MLKFNYVMSKQEKEMCVFKLNPDVSLWKYYFLTAFSLIWATVRWEENIRALKKIVKLCSEKKNVSRLTLLSPSSGTYSASQKKMATFSCKCMFKHHRAQKRTEEVWRFVQIYKK